MGIDDFDLDDYPDVSHLKIYQDSAARLQVARSVYASNPTMFERDHNEQFVCIVLTNPEQPDFYFSKSYDGINNLIEKRKLEDCYIRGINVEMPCLELDSFP